MTTPLANEFGFAPVHDVPVPYLQRTREYYLALGYGEPYQWAHYAEVPFQSLDKPLASCSVAIVTTAAPYRAECGDQGPGAPYNAAAKFYRVYSGDTAIDPDLRIAHVAIDRAHTPDINSYFPLGQRRAPRRPRCRGALPQPRTNRSHRVTPEVDCCELVARCRRPLDGAAGAQLPGVPPEREPGRAHARVQRHRHRGNGLLQGHRRTRRRAASAVLGFPARQCRRPAARCGVAGLAARTGPAIARARTGAEHHGAVAAALERQRRLEARLLQRAAPVGRRTAAAALRVRRRQGAGQAIARRRCARPLGRRNGAG